MSERFVKAVCSSVQQSFSLPLRVVPLAMRDPLPALGTDPVHGLEFGGSVLNDGENLGSEAPDQLLRQDGSNALHQAAAEVALDPLSRGRRHGFHGACLELQPMPPYP
jgi:hypothetical protein